MSRSLKEQLCSFGLGSDNPSKNDAASERPIQTLRKVPAPSDIAESSEPSKHRCEVGGWMSQKLLTFGSDRKIPVRYRPILLWRERDFHWVVFPGSSIEKPPRECCPPNAPGKALFYFVEVTDWEIFDDSNPYNFTKHSYFSRRYETITLNCFDPIGRLKDKPGIQYRQWATKIYPPVNTGSDSQQSDFKA